MARKTTTGVAPKRSATLSLEQLKLAVPRIKRRIAELEELDPATLTADTASARLKALRASIEEALAQTFGHDSVEYERYEEATTIDHALRYSHAAPDDEVRKTIVRYRKRSLALLQQAVKALEERLSEVA